MSPEQRITAERIRTTLTILMAQDRQRETAAAAEIGSDRITRCRHAIDTISAVLAASGYDLLSCTEVRVAGDIRAQRWQAITLQLTEQLHEARERIAELEGVTQ